MTGLQLAVKYGNLGTVELLVNLSKSHEQLFFPSELPMVDVNMSSLYAYYGPSGHKIEAKNLYEYDLKPPVTSPRYGNNTVQKDCSLRLCNKLSPITRGLFE